MTPLIKEIIQVKIDMICEFGEIPLSNIATEILIDLKDKLKTAKSIDDLLQSEYNTGFIDCYNMMIKDITDLHVYYHMNKHAYSNDVIIDESYNAFQIIEYFNCMFGDMLSVDIVKNYDGLNKFSEYHKITPEYVIQIIENYINLIKSND